MVEKKAKYYFNAKTWQLYIDAEYFPLPGILSEFLFYLTYTIDQIPFLSADEVIKGKRLSILRKRLGKKIGSSKSKELIENLSGYGYRLNPELLNKGLLKIVGKPSNEFPSLQSSLDIEDYQPYQRNTGGYHEPE